MITAPACVFPNRVLISAANLDPRTKIPLARLNSGDNPCTRDKVVGLDKECNSRGWSMLDVV